MSLPHQIPEDIDILAITVVPPAIRIGIPYFFANSLWAFCLL